MSSKTFETECNVLVVVVVLTMKICRSGGKNILTCWKFWRKPIHNKEKSFKRVKRVWSVVFVNSSRTSYLVMPKFQKQNTQRTGKTRRCFTKVGGSQDEDRPEKRLTWTEGRFSASTVGTSSCNRQWFDQWPAGWEVAINNNATCNGNGYGSTRCLFKSNVTAETAVFTCCQAVVESGSGTAIYHTNPNLSSDAKYYQYISVFGRYQNLRQTKQQPANIQTADVKTLETDTQTGDDLPIVTLPVEERRLIGSLPKPVRRKGRILLDHIKADPQNFQWLKSGELLSPEGNPIPGSNITDLLHYATRNRKTALPPVGFGEFEELLDDTNVPKEALSLPEQPDIASPKAKKMGKKPTTSDSSKKPTPPPKRTRAQTQRWQAYWFHLALYIFDVLYIKYLTLHSTTTT